MDSNLKRQNSLLGYRDRAKKHNEKFYKAKTKFMCIVEEKVNAIIRDDPLFETTKLTYDDYGNIYLSNNYESNGPSIIERYWISAHHMKEDKYPETILIVLNHRSIGTLDIYPNEKELSKQIKNYEELMKIIPDKLAKIVETAITLVKKYDIINESSKIWNDEINREIKTNKKNSKDQLRIVKTHSEKLKCNCKSNTWLFKNLSSWDESPIEEATFIHVICINCGSGQGLLGKKGDWSFEIYCKQK